MDMSNYCSKRNRDKLSEQLVLKQRDNTCSSRGLKPSEKNLTVKLIININKLAKIMLTRVINKAQE